MIGRARAKTLELSPGDGWYLVIEEIIFHWQLNNRSGVERHKAAAKKLRSLAWHRLGLIKPPR